MIWNIKISVQLTMIILVMLHSVTVLYCVIYTSWIYHHNITINDDKHPRDGTPTNTPRGGTPSKHPRILTHYFHNPSLLATSQQNPDDPNPQYAFTSYLQWTPFTHIKSSFCVWVQFYWLCIMIHLYRWYSLSLHLPLDLHLALSH